MEKELLFITVIGEDKKGIVAKISNLMYECDINIEDINQIFDKYGVKIVDKDGTVIYDPERREKDIEEQSW